MIDVERYCLHCPLLLEQAYYLEFLEHNNLVSSSGVVEPCSDGCSSSEIVFPYDFPFGGYFHQTAFVSWSSSQKM